MRTFCVAGGGPQIKSFRKDILKAMKMKRTVVVKFFQLKVNMVVTEIEARLKNNTPINLDITTHFGVSTKSLAPSDFIMNACWGWGKLSYSQIDHPDLTLYIYPDGFWDFHSGKQSFQMLQDWNSASEMLLEVYHSIIYEVLKLDDPGAC